MKKNVLIIDDDFAITNILKASLQMFNYEIITYTNSIQAFEELQKKKYDIIITDIMMPNLDGIELIQKVKKETINSDSSIIILSGKVLNENDKKSIFKNNCYYISKPFMPNQIINIVKKIENQ